MKNTELNMEFFEYDNIRGRLRVKLLNEADNAEAVRDAVFERAGCGYILVPYITCALSGSGFDGIRVTKDLAQAFGYDTGILMKDALDNTQRLAPAGLDDLRDVFRSIGPGFPAPQDVAPFFVLSNSDHLFGAAALFYPGTLEMIFRRIGGNYFVLPSSIHEMVILKDVGDCDARSLAEMVKSVNEKEVDPREQLGNKVMYYDAKKGSLSVVAEAV